ncbi:Inactive dipeptidyl peptidase 10 [Liparis tanakae]|uniref:Inactive dipeptidyl peptidase 10 n=1 Tax=Liparis tanakae TaxID=230148 RepID=A0A4Z2FUQ1_9TELE|nr:Inactive dipeptidyl peptidase 10 [Liparis tanakae]
MQHVLFAFEVKPLYRHSYVAKYIIYSLVTQETWPLKPPEVHEGVLQFAGWGPRGEQLVRRPYSRDYTASPVSLGESDRRHSRGSRSVQGGSDERRADKRFKERFGDFRGELLLL